MQTLDLIQKVAEHFDEGASRLIDVHRTKAEQVQWMLVTRLNVGIAPSAKQEDKWRLVLSLRQVLEERAEPRISGNKPEVRLDISRPGR